MPLNWPIKMLVHQSPKVSGGNAGIHEIIRLVKRKSKVSILA